MLMTARVVCFGEIMLRLSPPGHQRFSQARFFKALYGGGEANVAISLSNFGVQADFITRLPANELGEACIQYLRQYSIGTDFILRGGERLGIYFLEKGSDQRGSKVIYDREGSSFATLTPDMLDWAQIIKGASWFHWTGITPAISESSAIACMEGIRTAHSQGVTISCDLNFRTKLWKWGKSANEVMPDMVDLCDIVFANEEDIEKIFHISSPEINVTAAKVEAEKFFPVCQELSERFPSLKMIAITLRGSFSASHNTWSAIIWKNGECYKTSLYNIQNIVDRVGVGDSFAAGLIYAFHQSDYSTQRALDFAVAASALKHSIYGDSNLVTVTEVEDIVSGNTSGRVIR
jgi:2-dehydro-3-deoxygluconokinase